MFTLYFRRAPTRVKSWWRWYIFQCIDKLYKCRSKCLFKLSNRMRIFYFFQFSKNPLNVIFVWFIFSSDFVWFSEVKTASHCLSIYVVIVLVWDGKSSNSENELLQVLLRQQQPAQYIPVEVKRRESYTVDSQNPYYDYSPLKSNLVWTITVITKQQL